MAEWETLFVNAELATMLPGTPYGHIEKAALGVSDSRIAFAAPMTALPRAPGDMADEVIDVEGRWITPGLIDCHTHMVFAGDRAGEFEMRLRGASYEEIAKAGGGIVSTVMATRAASGEELVTLAAARLQDFIAGGVTTVEIKSGYGLDAESEVKMLRAARRLAADHPVRVRTTFLGAHALAPEFAPETAESRDGYIRLVTDEMMPLVAKSGLADAVDAFMEGIAFTEAETRRVFEKARELGLPVKLHADQLSDTGGAALAAEFGALSADHLEYTSLEGVAAMAASGSVAVLLPGAFYTLAETQIPPIQALRDAAVPIAVASDCNPGTSPARSLLAMMNMGCTLFGLTPEEALAGTTRNAALALGILDETGTLEPGKAADLAIWDIADPAELSYWIGGNPLWRRVFGGR